MNTYWDCLPTGSEADEDSQPRVSSRALRRFAGDILTAAGLEPDDADAAASCLVLADLRGVGTHGAFRLMQYADSIAAGDINCQPFVRVLSQTGATALVDADGGYGYRPALMGMDMAIDIASRLGVGAVVVRNSHHFGMAAAFALRAAERGSIGFVTTNSLPQIAPPGASRAVVGNNPYSVAVPRATGRKPIVIDIALTEAPFGTAALALLAGRALAPGLALNSMGLPTTDPSEALQSGALVAIGRQKGYALSVASEVLSAALSGSPIASQLPLPSRRGRRRRPFPDGHQSILLHRARCVRRCGRDALQPDPRSASFRPERRGVRSRASLAGARTLTASALAFRCPRRCSTP